MKTLMIKKKGGFNTGQNVSGHKDVSSNTPPPLIGGKHNQ
jgi:hypothetical protein